MDIDAEVLERSLDGLRERTEAATLTDALSLCVHTAARVFAATGAGLMLIDDSSVLRAVAATDAPGRALEEAQVKLGEGPCVDALLNDEIVAVEDLAHDPRWPRLRPELPTAGVRAVLGAPVHIAGGPVGSVNIYRDAPWAWDNDDIDALGAYARVVEGVLVGALQSRQQSEIARQLRQALDDRVKIERAVGLVMGRDRVDAVSAFNRLRRSARDSGRPVADVAGDLLRGAIDGRSW